VTDQPDATEPKKRDATLTRQAILAAAREEFAAHGLSGARVDAIAARTNAVKRMIYYYFGSKEGLYLAVLEAAYAEIRRVEQDLALDALAPQDAIRRLIEFTFDYDEANPDFIRLITIENIHRGQHVAGSDAIRAINRSALTTLEGILDRGRASGVFRRGVDALDVHMMISAVCF